MSLPFGADPKNGRGTQASDSMPKDGDIHGSHHHERPENTNPHYNEYATILKTHLGIVESELSRLKSTQMYTLSPAFPPLPLPPMRLLTFHIIAAPN